MENLQTEENKEKNCCEKVLDAFNQCLQKEKISADLVGKSDHISADKLIKILVLGPGGSGKSTILKQMRIIHGQSYSEDERKKYKILIVGNIFESIIQLVNAMRSFQIRFINQENDDFFSTVLQTHESLQNGLDHWNKHLDENCKRISSIWDDPSIKETYLRRNKYYLNDSTEYFMTHLPRICTLNYIPLIDDLLRVRQPTTAVLEYRYKISNTYFMFVDVGGQRSERRKWLSCFENVTSLLFVASLSDYDLTLSKDELRSTESNTNIEVNRLKEALDLFQTLINWKRKTFVHEKDSRGIQIRRPVEILLFERVSIILFLNKEDLFTEKFKRVSLKVCFNDYTDMPIEKAKRFVAQKFLDCDKSSMISNFYQRDIYWHYTFALDRRNIETVVASLKDRILRNMLESMRL